MRVRIALIEEIGIGIILAVFDGAQEGEFLRVFSDLADILVFQEGFAHFGEVAAFGAAAGFEVGVGVGEVEVGAAAFAAQHAAVDVFEEFGDCFFVGGALFVAGRGLVYIDNGDLGVLGILTRRTLLVLFHPR